MAVKKFPEELKKAKYIIEWFMTKRCGLQPFFTNYDGSVGRIIFEMCNWESINELAAYGGFPTRYHHWQHGMEYEQLQKGYTYGLSKIYEMVINNDPCIAYLLEDNDVVDQKMVMAHVYGHADFFVNNVYYAPTNKKAVNMFANHKFRIDDYIVEHGEDVVETWIDSCLIMENLIDIHGQVLVRHDESKLNRELREEKEDEKDKEWSGKFESKEYMDKFVNPKERVEEYQKKLKEKRRRQKDVEERGIIFPAEPERDILWFLAHNAPLENWQRDILLIVREEALYFAPQGQTKIMNEGWAAYWHSMAMTSGMAEDSEIIDYADHNSGTLALHLGHLNPYLLGRSIFRDIEWRWNTHRRGCIYEKCNDSILLNSWDHFVAFKNIYEDYQNDQKGFNKKWNEFLCLWSAFKNGLCDIPLEIYDSRLLLCYWHCYQNIEECFKPLDVEISEYVQEAGKWSELVKKTANKKGRKHALSMLDLCKQKIRHTQRSRKMLLRINKVKAVLSEGKIKPDLFNLPKEFFDYSGEYPGKLLINDGRRKIFEVRKHYCDVTFIDEFLTRDLCDELNLFSYDYDKDSDLFLIDSYEFDQVKAAFLARLTNVGHPYVRIVDGNFNNRGELLLKHYSDELELDRNWAFETLVRGLYPAWQRPVHLETVKGDKKIILSYNGKETSQKEIS